MSKRRAASLNDKGDKKFADAVARMLHRVDLTEGHEGKRAADATALHQQGPLTPQELAELSFLCTAAAAAAAAAAKPTKASTAGASDVTEKDPSGFALVEGEQLIGLMELLDRHVNLAVTVNLMEAAAAIAAASDSPTHAATAVDLWFKSGEGKDKVAALRGGLEAATIILFIVNSPGIDRRAVSEDAIEASITLMRLHLSKHLVPAFNETGHFMAASAKTKEEGSPSKKRRRSSGAAGSSSASSVAAKDLKKVYKHITATINLQLVLMDRLESLVQSLPLDDQQVLLLTNGALPAFEIDCNASAVDSKDVPPAQQLQTASIALLTAAFREYPMHRGIILEDLFPVMLNLPTGKRSLRAFPVRYSSSPSSGLEALNAKLVGPLLSNGAQPHFIQMMTALVLSLVHACVMRPTYEVENSNEEEEQQTVGKLQSGLRTCKVVADSFVAQLLKRCTKSKSGGASEYRPILANIVEDLLLVLMIPEYPAAELLLSVLQRRLNQDLTMASPIFGVKNSQQPQPEATYLNSAFDAMGKICAVQARILAAVRDKPIHMTTEAPLSNTSSSDQDVACHCKNKRTDVLLVQCDHCNTLFHGPCVGIPDKESLPDEWLCDPCCLGKIVGRERRKVSDDEAAYMDQYYAMHHSFQAITAHRLGVDMEDAVHFHLARWVDELERKRLADDIECHPRKIVDQLLEYWDVPGPAAELLTDEGRIRVILGLMADTSPFFLSFRTQIGFLLKIMSDESSHSLRKLSLKVIEKCVEGDQSLMLLPVMTKAVSKRLSDESISVREAAVSLVGSYVVKSPLAIQSYHAALVPCLTDPGVSVRKRALKIFQAILSENPHYRGRSTVCSIMLQRSADPKEEDGVRDLIDEAFCMLWLRDGDEPVSQFRGKRSLPIHGGSVQVASIPGVVTPNSPIVVSKRKTPQLRSDLAAEQMMEVVRAGGTGENLEALLKKLLSGGISSDNGRKQAERQMRQELGQKQCTQLVNSLFELLVVVDEQRDIRPQVGKDIAATLATISVFANVSPHPILKHYDTILPYLKADNGVSMEDESAIVCATCDIIFRLTPAFDHQVMARLINSSVAKDLTKISYKFGPVALASAVRAFSALANRPDSGGKSFFAEKLLDVAKTFYGYAGKKNAIDDFSSTNDNVKNSVHRALTVLGLICENREITVDSSNWGDEVEKDAPLLPEAELTWESSTLACYRLFSRYLQKADSATKCKALAALKGIFVAQPQLLLQLDHIGLFDEVMSDRAGVPLQLEALECWRNILEAEERRIDSGKAASAMDADGNITVSKRISGDQNGDATLFGGVLTNHAERLFEMTHASNPTIRHSTLQLLGLLLRQGLVNPNEAVPHLFALQGDIGNELIRSLALCLLMTEGEKRPDTLRQRICAGVKQAYKFQRAVYPSKAQVSAIVVTKCGKKSEVHSIFGSVFEECIVKNRKQRLSLYKSLLGLFELDDYDGATRKSKSASKDLSLLSFAAQILAHLPYTTAADPLYIVHHITSIITLQGLHTLDRLAEFLRPYGLSSSDEFDENNAEEDALEKAAHSKFPSRTHEARPLSSKDFDMAGFVDLVRDGAALTLLLRLKNFLCASYNLSVTRRLAYDPSAKELLCEKGIAKAKFSEPFDASVADVLLQTDGAVDKDELVRQYAELRSRMRDESAIEARAKDSEDDNDSEEIFAS